MMRYYLSLGANIGEREATIQRALDILQQKGCTLIAQSSPYYSAPVGFRSENEFCNLCASIESTMEPEQMLLLTQDIERQLGRSTKSTTDDFGNPIHYDRNIDIDIILCYSGEQQITCDTPTLSLPHPRYQERPFVTIPLREILRITK